MKNRVRIYLYYTTPILKPAEQTQEECGVLKIPVETNSFFGTSRSPASMVFAKQNGWAREKKTGPLEVGYSVSEKELVESTGILKIKYPVE